jgi:hypothetical protein
MTIYLILTGCGGFISESKKTKKKSRNDVKRKLAYDNNNTEPSPVLGGKQAIASAHPRTSPAGDTH